MECYQISPADSITGILLKNYRIYLYPKMVFTLCIENSNLYAEWQANTSWVYNKPTKANIKI